jgi:hypothetical protein
MKKYIILTTIFVSFFVSFPKDSNAIFMPFAGKIIPFPTPLLCTGGEPPIMIKPVGAFPPGMYGVTPLTKRYSYGVLTPGSWVVGFYEVIPAPICFVPIPPPAVPIPVLALPIIKFGVSLPSLSL